MTTKRTAMNQLVRMNAMSEGVANGDVVFEFRTGLSSTGELAWMCHYFTTGEFNSYDEWGFGWTPAGAFDTLSENEENRTPISAAARAVFEETVTYRLTVWSTSPDGARSAVEIVECTSKVDADRIVTEWRDRCTIVDDSWFRHCVTTNTIVS